jgi:hypothetical protein
MTRKTATADIDIAIFPIPSEVLLTLAWRTMSVESIAAVGPQASTNEFLFFGYPDDRVIQQGEWLRANPVLVRTCRYRGPNTYRSFHPQVNLLLQ